MNQKSIEHIALYSFVLVGILVVGVLARQFVLSKGFDDFSSSVAFFATVIVLMAIYASLQTTFNQFLLPRIEAFLLHFTAFQTIKLIKEINELLTKNKIPIKPDTIKLKGIQENQLMWKDILLKDISVGYYNVSKINVALFDRSISSLKQKMK